MTCLLAIDTATDACSVALWQSEERGAIKEKIGEISQSISNTPREHTQRVLPMVEALLAEKDLAIQSLDAIAYSAGPGSFTGLRIGLSVAQGLAYGADLPLVPISTLQTLAQTTIRQQKLQKGQIVIPVIDARMNEVYWSAYSVTDDNLAEPITKEHIADPESFLEALQSMHFDCGSGSGWHYECLQTFSDKVLTNIYPEAQDLLTLSIETLNNGTTQSPLEAVPTYLRDEISWKKRERIRN